MAIVRFAPPAMLLEKPPRLSRVEFIHLCKLAETGGGSSRRERGLLNVARDAIKKRRPHEAAQAFEAAWLAMLGDTIPMPRFSRHYMKILQQLAEFFGDADLLGRVEHLHKAVRNRRPQEVRQHFEAVWNVLFIIPVAKDCHDVF